MEGICKKSPIFCVYEKATVAQKEQAEKKCKENCLWKTKGEFVYKNVWDKAMSTVSYHTSALIRNTAEKRKERHGAKLTSSRKSVAAN